MTITLNQTDYLLEVLLNYANSSSISESSLDMIEDLYDYFIKSMLNKLTTEITSELLSQASIDLCDKAKIAHGSNLICCIASILDFLRPNLLGKSRYGRTLDLILYKPFEEEISVSSKLI